MTTPGENQTAPIDSEEISARPIGRRREDRIIGSSAATRRVIEQATAAARSDLPVLVVGPPGAGKEVVARAVHAWSDRASAPFEEVSTASIPEGLQIRELVGAAESVHAGLPGLYRGGLERAGSGTVLVDAIDGLKPAPRRILLEAATSGSFRREGDSEEQELRCRIVATAETRLSEPPFGELPFHEIQLKPLAERSDDILPLAAWFLASFSEEAGITPVGFTADARARLLAEPWPGNVRELRERIRLAVRLAGSGAISAEALLLAADGEEIMSFKEAKRAFETRYVTGLLRRCEGNISRAARLAKKDRKDFYDVIRRTGVDPQQFRH